MVKIEAKKCSQMKILILVTVELIKFKLKINQYWILKY